MAKPRCQRHDSLLPFRRTPFRLNQLPQKSSAPVLGAQRPAALHPYARQTGTEEPWPRRLSPTSVHPFPHGLSQLRQLVRARRSQPGRAHGLRTLRLTPFGKPVPGEPFHTERSVRKPATRYSFTASPGWLGLDCPSGNRSRFGLAGASPRSPGHSCPKQEFRQSDPGPKPP
jgi:hypothetical protein